MNPTTFVKGVATAALLSCQPLSAQADAWSIIRQGEDFLGVPAHGHIAGTVTRAPNVGMLYLSCWGYFPPDLGFILPETERFQSMQDFGGFNSRAVVLNIDFVRFDAQGNIATGSGGSFTIAGSNQIRAFVRMGTTNRYSVFFSSDEAEAVRIRQIMLENVRAFDAMIVGVVPQSTQPQSEPLMTWAFVLDGSARNLRELEQTCQS